MYWREDDYDVAVVGAGFWGAACAIALRERGFRVLCVDSGEPRAASPNSSGKVRPSSLRGDIVTRLVPQDWDHNAVDFSVEWLTRTAGLVETEEVFENWSGHKPPRMRRGLWLLPLPDDLIRLANPTRATVERLIVSGDDVRVQFRDAVVRTRAVVVAAGIWTPSILEASGLTTLNVERMYGRNVLLRNIHYGETRTILAAPYREYTLRPWGAYSHFGDTVEPISRNGLDGVSELFAETLRQAVPDYTVARVNVGIRPVTTKFWTGPTKESKRVVIATGGNRVGLGFAGYVGKYTADYLESVL